VALLVHQVAAAARAGAPASRRSQWLVRQAAGSVPGWSATRPGARDNSGLYRKDLRRRRRLSAGRMTATTRRLGAVARHVGRHASGCPHDKDSPAGARRAPLNATPAAHEGAQDLGGLEEQMTVDVLVVGAGFAGMIALRRFRDELGLRVRVLEQGSGVGGTWYWNAYPGAHCDVPVLEYSPGFDAELERDYSSEWTGLFASQPELLRYAEHMKERFDLARSITFDTKVVGCEWDAAAAQWGVRTDTGSSQWRASVVVACIGCLSQPNVPEIAGADSFAGEVYTTSRFPHEGVDFHGKRVAVIGTGSSGIQAIPVIAREAEHLLVFQRTPQYTLPAGQRPISDRLRSRTVENYGAVRAFNRASAGGFGGLAGAVPKKKGLDGTAHNASATAAPPAPPPPPVGILDLSWEERLERLHEAGLACLYTWADVLTDMEANAAACELFAEWLRQSVHDPDTAAKLTPTNQVSQAAALVMRRARHAAATAPQ
jgi:cyclohexanone monooxygenase